MSGGITKGKNNDILSPLKLKKFIEVLSIKDKSSPIYFSGSELVEIFNQLGFEDTYDFEMGES